MVPPAVLQAASLQLIDTTLSLRISDRLAACRTLISDCDDHRNISQRFFLEAARNYAGANGSSYVSNVGRQIDKGGKNIFIEKALGLWALGL